MVLLVSNSRDFATDYVVHEFRLRGQEYYRLDLDLAYKDRVYLDPVRQELHIHSADRTVLIDSNSLQSIFFRAPTHLRESSGHRLPPEELLARHQWTAFSRSLMVFDEATWVNHPRNTYQSENKPFQLRVASEIGFLTPETLIGNAAPFEDHHFKKDDSMAIKALDSFLVRVEDGDAFFYTQSTSRAELETAELGAMPIILQRLLRNKLDIRVTVIGDECFSASISVGGQNIEGDWRLMKNQCNYIIHTLPEVIKNHCLALTKALGLGFGAIDLAVIGNDYYFLEINPTGEWAWLQEAVDFPLASRIADYLTKK
jgi:glutathione synthase/RimK-type ligase-like ATP-grasp enzyme